MSDGEISEFHANFGLGLAPNFQTLVWESSSFPKSIIINSPGRNNLQEYSTGFSMKGSGLIGRWAFYK